MIDRSIRIFLLAGLMLSAAAAVVGSVRILVGYLLGTHWFWGGAFAAYFGPLAFAGALRLHDLSSRTRLTSVPEDTDA